MYSFGVAASEASTRIERDSRVHSVRRARQGILTVTSVVRKQPGGSQSRLVRCDDGKLYVLKMNPNPQGPNVLANEAIGAMLIRGLGLPAPPWKPVTIDLKTVRFFPELAMETANHETIFPACGTHFGSEYLGGPQYDPHSFMPAHYRHILRNPAQLIAISLFDIWASHQDERQCLHQRTGETNLYETFFIDNGHLFGGPTWSHVAGRSRTVFSGNVQAPLVGDPRVEQWLRVFEDRIPKLLHHAVGTVPREWYKDDIYTLYAHLLERLECIRALVNREVLNGSRSARVMNSRVVPPPVVGLHELLMEGNAGYGSVEDRCGLQARLLGVDEPADPSPAFPLEVAVCGASIVGNSRYAARFLSRAKS